MEIQKFIRDFASQFEETDITLFNSKTDFKNEIDEWDSLISLSIIAMIDEKYGITIKGEDINNSKTIEDLFILIKQKHGQ